MRLQLHSTAAGCSRRLLPLLLFFLLVVKCSTRVEREVPDVTCPDFFLIGAMDCGTMTLKNLLLDHLPIKEHTKADYSNASPHDAQKAATKTMDISHRYLYQWRAPEQIQVMCASAEHNPKFIVSLCNPAQRSWLHFLRQLKMGQRQRSHGGLVASFDSFVMTYAPKMQQCLDLAAQANQTGPLMEQRCTSKNDRAQPVLAYSLYREFLRHWYTFLPESSFLVLSQDDWEQQSGLMLDRVASHFGIEGKIAPRQEFDEATARSTIHGGGINAVPSKWALHFLEEMYSREGNWEDLITTPLAHS